MLDSNEALLSAIRLGEDSRLEFKEMVFAGGKLKGPSRESIADSLAAFANAKGGVLVLGIGDGTREVVGIPLDRLDLAEQIVREICTTAIKPPLEGAIRKIELPASDGTMRAVLRVDIDRSPLLHQSPGGHYERFGASKRQMSTDRIIRIAQQRSQSRLLSFDEEIVGRATLADLDRALIERFRSEGNHDSFEVLARKFGMAREDQDGTSKPTVAGLLMGSAQPRTFLPGAWIQAVSYRGIDADAGPAYQLDAKDFIGPLDLQVAEACVFVLRNMRVEASKDAGREDVPQYDVTAVFEALTNAVAHRDYSLHGAHIRLRMFADRLEIRSPGALPNGLDIESMAERQVSRNSTIASLLARVAVPEIPDLRSGRRTMMDRRGEGVPVILRRTAALARKPATIRLVGDEELVVTLPAASALLPGPSK